MLDLISRKRCLFLSSLVGLLLVPEVCSLANLFRVYKGVYNNNGWGQYCYDLSEYVPSCGWKIIVISPVVFTKFEVFDSTYTSSDNYTFLLTNLGYRADLSKDKPGTCTNINYYGPFGNTVPDILITWYCVCDNTTAGKCQFVYTPTTTTESTTLNPLLADSAHWIAGKQARTDFCYVGEQKLQLSTPVHLVDCGATCYGLSKCMGINYHSSKQCDLVFENVDLNPVLLREVDGCFYWKVLEKL